MTILKKGKVGDIYCFTDIKNLAEQGTKSCAEIVELGTAKDRKVVRMKALETGESIEVMEPDDPQIANYDEQYRDSQLNPDNWLPHKHYLTAHKVIDPINQIVPKPLRYLISLILAGLKEWFLLLIFIATWAVAHQTFDIGHRYAFMLALAVFACGVFSIFRYGEFHATLDYVAKSIR